MSDLNMHKVGAMLKPKFKKFEAIIVLVLLAGAAIFYFTSDHNAILLNFGFAFLALLYFLRAFVPVEGETMNKTDYFANNALYWGLAALVVGIQFRIMNFPGYETQLSVGSFFVTASLVFCIFWLSKHKEKKATYMPFVYRGIIFLALGLVMYSVPAQDLEELHIIKVIDEYEFVE